MIKKIEIGKTYKDKEGKDIKIIYILKGINKFCPIIGILEEDNDEYIRVFNSKGYYNGYKSNKSLILEDFINWDTLPIVKSLENDIIVKVIRPIGRYKESFEGVVITSFNNNYQLGHLSKDWHKNSFKLKDYEI